MREIPEYTEIAEKHREEDLKLEQYRKEVTSHWGVKDIEDYDVCVCGNDIVNIVLAAEKYSGFDTSEARAEIEKKRVWLKVMFNSVFYFLQFFDRIIM